MSEHIRMLRVAILGPVNTTRRDEEAGQFANVRRMVRVANAILRLGCVPNVPALCSFWHMIEPLPRSVWVEISRNEILRSDACFRMDGPSSGSEQEIEFAEESGIPVFYSLEELADWSRKKDPSNFVARQWAASMFDGFERGDL